MYKGFWIACYICLALGPISKVTAQYVRVGVQGEIPLGKLDAMEDLLGLADANQKADLLARLGVDPVIAKQVAEHLMPGEKIELQPIRARGESHFGVAFLPGGTGVSCYLYLLGGSDEDPVKMPWHVIGHQQLNCWDGSASLEIMPLRQSDADDLVLYHVTEGHGSGYLAQQAQIFSILGGKLVETLATQDFLSQVTLGTETDNTLEQKSTFLRFPNNSLEETRTSAINGKLKKVERRYWRWSEQKHRLVPGSFTPVVAPSF